MKKNIAITVLGLAVCILALLLVTTTNDNRSSSNDSVETERKFLLDIDNIPAFDSKTERYEFAQTYISYSPEMRVRQVTHPWGVDYYFTLKLPMDDVGLSRQEFEVQITFQEYKELLKKQVGTTIYKTRYQFYESGFYMSVDVYSHELQSLAVAEVEFDSVEEAEGYVPPAWFGKDITSDTRYKNANLAKDGLPQK